MTTVKYSSMDGEVIQYNIMSGMTPMRNTPFDQDNFYPADGDYSNAGGLRGLIDRAKEKSQERKENRAERKEDRQERKNIRTESKAEARTSRSAAKLATAEAQKEIGKSLNTTDPAITALLNQPSTTPRAKSGMSTGAKVGIAIAVVALVAGIGYMVYKKGKK